VGYVKNMVDETNSGSCLVVGFCIKGRETSGSAAIVLVISQSSLSW
jgi:hypothetical protein